MHSPKHLHCWCPFQYFTHFWVLTHESYSEQTNEKHNPPPVLDAILRLAALLTWSPASLCRCCPRYCQRKAFTKIVSELSDTQAMPLACQHCPHTHSVIQIMSFKQYKSMINQEILLKIYSQVIGCALCFAYLNNTAVKKTIKKILSIFCVFVYPLHHLLFCCSQTTESWEFEKFAKYRVFSEA